MQASFWWRQCSDMYISSPPPPPPPPSLISLTVSVDVYFPHLHFDITKEMYTCGLQSFLSPIALISVEWSFYDVLQGSSSSSCDATAIIMLIILSLYEGSAAQKRKEKKEGLFTFWITADWRPLTQMCRWSWPQWLPGARHSSLWWFSAGMSTAGTGFCSAAERTADCVFVVDCSFAQCTDLPSTKEQLFVCASSSIDNLVKRTQLHSKVCDQPLETNAVTLSGHVGVFRLQCAKDHRISWHSSPYLGDKYLVNSRMAHGYFISGILPNQYERIMTATGIGILGNAYLNTFFESYSECVKALAKESTREALLEEIVTYEDMDGINILTDARHATRKNSKYTDVICLGANSHKVLHYETVTRGDDPCAQRHESLGTQRIYDHLQSQENGSVHIRVHCHDRNASVNKWIRDNRPDTELTNDTWHAAKNVAKEVRSVCAGPRHLEGKTWHPQLSDKAASVKTHFYWCMKNCEQDPLKLKSMILNIIEHYKNNHVDCHPSSRCKTDVNYEPSKTIISDSNAELLLRKVLERTLIYKSPGDFVHCMDTYLVECFNNSMLQYHDKRLGSHFGEKLYKFRTDLSVLDWNDHVNSRRVTSTKHQLDQRNPRRQSVIRRLKDKKYCFGGTVWQEYTAIYLRWGTWSDISCMCLLTFY